MSSHEDCPYALVKSLNTPAPISSLEFGHAGHIFAGSRDGTLRLYDLSSFKVLKAVRGLKDEISSIACLKRPETELRDAWVACGNHVYLFKMDTPSLIMTEKDAISSLKLTEDDDVLNEVCIALDKKHLAFTTDIGLVGVVELSTSSVTTMKERHASICSCVAFVPDRPRELVSAGYDETILHFDFPEGTTLSQHKISSSQAIEGMSLSPPFIMSTAMSANGVLAAGTADGQLWIGFGGQKGLAAKTKTKKARKWNGLSDQEKMVCTKVADGPLVAMSFSTTEILTASTLLGTIVQWKINGESSDQASILEELWKKEVTGMEKVNALVANDTKIIIGGFTKDEKGVIEIWDKRAIPQNTTAT
ncbi:hypothetical protein GYMLUDRAFT_169355 [Collybiopsis luxurians FD-317 M1]|uniref:WD40 repeat-like protein n=1 Tax=Collybiopsis luxurians FD-317 M1 TaxID=944289 RepID=A0A0D0BVN6_9AGAR|nr:hypothetical protein GYMLUDRAFT_169355 [Collybiopsis luxurians FD-317 M1]